MDESDLQFPLHMHADGDDYIIERENEANSPPSPNYFTSPEEAGERTRLKRRRRCGQCGPCQIKENCNKCHYCIRKDVLKQTCIYRKCVYLRSKPKPYSRLREFPQIPRHAIAPDPQPQVVKSPPVMGFSEPPHLSSPIQKTSETESCVNPFLPPEIQERTSFNLPTGQHAPPVPIGNSASVTPVSSVGPENQEPVPTNHLSSVSPFHQPGPPASSQLEPGRHHISSPPSINNTSRTPPVSHGLSFSNSRTPPVNHGLSHVPPPQQMSHQQHPVMPSHPSRNFFSDRVQPATMLSEKPSSHSLSSEKTPPTSIFSERAPPTSMFSDALQPPSIFSDRMPPPNMFSDRVPPSSMLSDRIPLTGMYSDRLFSDVRSHPPYGIPAHPMFQHQHSLPFPYMRPGFGEGPYPSKSPGFPDTRSAVPPSQCMYPPSFHSSMTSVIDRPSYQTNMERPQNGPPMFPTNSEMFRPYSTQGYLVPPGGGFYPQTFTRPHFPRFSGMGMQPPSGFPPGPPQGNNSQAINFPVQPHPSCEQSSGCPKNGCCPPVSLSVDTDSRVMQERYGSIHKSSAVSGFRPLPWGPDYLYRFSRRPTSALSDDTSRTSMTSSDFECDVISIDDLRVNALIRSDGCNSIEIEIDDRVSEVGQLSSCSSNFGTKSPGMVQLDKSLEKSPSFNSDCESPQKTIEKVKVTVKGVVCLKQDLGDEGIIQLEIPGERVTIEESDLDDSLAKYSCNLDDLIAFIQKEPKIEYVKTIETVS